MGFLDKVRVAIFGDFGGEMGEMGEMGELAEHNDYGDPYSRKDHYRDLKPVRDAEETKIKEFKTAGSNVINIHPNIQMKVVVTSPENFDEAQDICDNIRRNNAVVINLEKIENASAQRIMDFVSGSCYALDGNVQRITSNIFLAAPNNVDISNDFKEEIKTKGFIAPWLSAKK